MRRQTNRSKVITTENRLSREPLLSNLRLPKVEWPQGEGPKVFACLRPDTSHAQLILSTLGEASGRAICVAPGFTSAQLRQYHRDHLARTLACAMMETVLHDVSAPPENHILDVERLREVDMRVSRVRCDRVFAMVDLSAKGLKRIGLQRTDLIDTPINDYPRTREWAVRLHAETAAHGLLWVSRQADEAKALVLFGDRIAESAFKPEIDREPLYEGEHLDALLCLPST